MSHSENDLIKMTYLEYFVNILIIDNIKGASDYNFVIKMI